MAAGRRGRAAAPAADALPIEVNRGARAAANDVAAELASDDSAQRFALIELDAASPTA